MIEELRAEAERLGVNVDGRWGAARLQQEIDAHQPADLDDEDEGAWSWVDEPTQEIPVVLPAAPDLAPVPPGGRRSWQTTNGRVKTTTVGSGLDQWYEQSPNWHPA